MKCNLAWDAPAKCLPSIITVLNRCRLHRQRHRFRLPIGATVARADIMNWGKGAHASTFGGNPVCIASALKTIELLQGGLVENSRLMGDYLQAGLRKMQEKYECMAMFAASA